MAPGQVTLLNKDSGGGDGGGAGYVGDSAAARYRMI